MALLLAVAAWALAGDARPADANHTKIIFSRSSISPTQEPNLILPMNGSLQDYYIWAVNVHNSTGVAAFDVRFEFDPDLLDFLLVEPVTAWLTSTNRSPACVWAIGPGGELQDGQAYVSCSTFTIPPPYGPSGTGVLAHVRMRGGPQIMSDVLHLSSSFLIDTPPNPADQQVIPASVPDVYITVGKCPDFDLNGTIDLFNDIFGVAFHFGLNAGDPGWDSIFDLDDNGSIDLFNDIFNAAFQFGGSC